ncbi:MAG: hypothetical protein JWN70_1872 [Planctomycetaceae bacterium]|nr:hypothetical protein [Planctomycetaceae bacterium]
MSMETTLRHSNAALLATLASGSTEQDLAHPRIRRINVQPAGTDRDQIVTLRPRPLLWLRKVLACGWSGYLLISPWSSSVRLDCCLLGLIVLGTFRTITVSNQQITWKYRFGFLPFYTSQLNLKDQTSIVTGWEERSGLGEALLLGLWGACVAPLADWLCPWRGGPYRLWVKSTQGVRTLIWRGRVERSFHRNHKLLGQATGLPSQRAPASESQPKWL